MLIPHEDVVTQLAADTLSTFSGLGVSGSRFKCGRFAQAAIMGLKVKIVFFELKS